MFNQNFAERNQKEVKLEAIDPKEFKELLNVIYPLQKPITGIKFYILDDFITC